MGQRKVLIGTPSYDGTLDVWYVNSLVGTVRESEDRGIRIDPVYMSYDALVQRARNDLVALAIEGGYDDLIFIDGDIEWDPTWIFQLLKYKQDVVGGTYRKKNDNNEDYVLKALDLPPTVDTRTGLIKVAGLGTGFMKISQKALTYLWKGAEPYIDHKGKNSRMVFDIAIQDGTLVSEDILMCQKLTEGGFDIWLDPRMCCKHVGPKKFEGNFIRWFDKIMNTSPLEQFLEDYQPQPSDHVFYLRQLKRSGFEPKVIYDVGACVGHWTKVAKTFWPDAQYFSFEAMPEAEPFLAKQGTQYNIDVLSDEDGREVKWHQNLKAPWGGSYYCENSINFSKDKFVIRKSKTLDTVARERNFPPPDFIKIDVQGTEIDILRGASNSLKKVEHLIVELQHTAYNDGAPQARESVPVIESLGFECVAPMFSNNGPDADYGFRRLEKFARAEPIG
jgi:FkbM family methyltransferase